MTASSSQGPASNPVAARTARDEGLAVDVLGAPLAVGVLGAPLAVGVATDALLEAPGTAAAAMATCAETAAALLPVRSA